MISESRSLLLGESIGSEMVKDLITLIESYPAVEHYAPPLTMHLAPRQILLTLDISFKKDLKGEEIVLAIKKLEENIQVQFPHITRIYIEARALAKQAQNF